MKKLFILATLVLGVMSCSKMDDIFNGTDKEAIAPISLGVESGTDVFTMEEINEIAPDLLKQNGVAIWEDHKIKEGDPFPNPSELTQSHPSEAAIVINDVLVINGVLSRCNLETALSTGRLEEYSLVVGFIMQPQSNYRVTSQRVKKSIKEINLYLKIENSGMGFCAPYADYFMALYHKLPSKPIRIYRSDLDD